MSSRRVLKLRPVRFVSPGRPTQRTQKPQNRTYHDRIEFHEIRQFKAPFRKYITQKQRGSEENTKYGSLD